MVFCTVDWSRCFAMVCLNNLDATFFFSTHIIEVALIFLTKLSTLLAFPCAGWSGNFGNWNLLRHAARCSRFSIFNADFALRIPLHKSNCLGQNFSCYKSLYGQGRYNCLWPAVFWDCLWKPVFQTIRYACISPAKRLPVEGTLAQSPHARYGINWTKTGSKVGGN